MHPPTHLLFSPSSTITRTRTQQQIPSLLLHVYPLFPLLPPFPHLLHLPPPLLLHTATYLPPKDLHSLLLGPTSRRLCEISQEESPVFWNACLLQALKTFLPARSFWDGPCNWTVTDDMIYQRLESIMIRFETVGLDNAIDCEHRVGAAMVAVLGEGIVTKEEFEHEWEEALHLARWWGWKEVRVGVGEGYPSDFFEVIRSVDLVPEILQYLPNSSSEAKAMYLKWMGAFACDKCEEPGAARRQCALCASFLCLPCSVRCARDNGQTCRKSIDAPEGDGFGEGSATSICGFALCKKCHADSILPYEEIYDNRVYTLPGLSANICRLCPPPEQELMCPAHLNWDIVECSYCEEDRRCLKHTTLLPTPSLPTKRYHEAHLRCYHCKNLMCGGPNCSGKDTSVLRCCEHEHCHRGDRQLIKCTSCQPGPTCDFCQGNLVVVEPGMV